MAAVVTSTEALRRQLAPWRGSGAIGFVPTMGALHQGHARLMELARRDCGRVVVSIFVNPLQFDRDDDLRRYPRRLDADVELCAAAGVDVVFAPAVDDVFPVPAICAIDVGRLGDQLCGRYRPGHFRGVATIVMKLFQMVQADRAYFGEKDAQQLAIVRRLVTDFNVPVTVVGVPTVRESDGLALSSRNQHLSAEERRLAPGLYQALRTAERLIVSGATDAAAIKAAAAAALPEHSRLRLEYLDIVEPDEMQPVAEVTAPVLVAAALWVGGTRLIDNVRCAPGRGGA